MGNRLTPPGCSPVVGTAEVPDPGQELAIDREFEPAFAAVDDILAAGLLLVVLDRSVERLADTGGDVLQRLLVPVEKRPGPLSRYAPLVQRVVRQPVVVRILLRAGRRVRRRIVLRRGDDFQSVLVVDRTEGVEAAGPAHLLHPLDDLQSSVSTRGPASQDPFANRLEPLPGHLGQLLRHAKVLREALGDLIGDSEQFPIGQDAKPGQRPARRIERVRGLTLLPRREKLRDPAQRHQRRQSAHRGEFCEKPLLRWRRCEPRLPGLRPFEQSGRKGAGVALREVRECADARVAPARERNDVRMPVRLVSPLRRDMEIGRHVPEEQTHGVQPVPEVGLRHFVADEGERYPGRLLDQLRERREEALDVHGRKLRAEEMSAVANDPGDLDRGGLCDIAVAVQSTSPISAEQSTRPSDGSNAMFRLLRRCAKAAVLCRRSSSSNPK